MDILTIIQMFSSNSKCWAIILSIIALAILFDVFRATFICIVPDVLVVGILGFAWTKGTYWLYLNSPDWLYYTSFIGIGLVLLSILLFILFRRTEDG